MPCCRWTLAISEARDRWRSAVGMDRIGLDRIELSPSPNRVCSLVLVSLGFGVVNTGDLIDPRGDEESDWVSATTAAPDADEE